jgi:hypothetical protein
MFFFRSGASIAVSERPIWSWEDTLYSLISGLVYSGLPVGLLTGLIGGLLRGLFFGLVTGLQVGLVGGLVAGLFIDLAPGVSERLYEGLVLGTIIGSIVGLVVRMFLGPVLGLTVGLIVWLGVGLVVGLTFGVGLSDLRNMGFEFEDGGDLLHHAILRFWLARSGLFPWRAVPFLEDATSRILLRRVGGGYSFAHRLLLDYFADLSTQTPLAQEAVQTKSTSVQTKVSTSADES